MGRFRPVAGPGGLDAFWGGAYQLRRGCLGRRAFALAAQRRFGRASRTPVLTKAAKLTAHILAALARPAPYPAQITSDPIAQSPSHGTPRGFCFSPRRTCGGRAASRTAGCLWAAARSRPGGAGAQADVRRRHLPLHLRRARQRRRRADESLRPPSCRAGVSCANVFTVTVFLGYDFQRHRPDARRSVRRAARQLSRRAHRLRALVCNPPRTTMVAADASVSTIGTGLLGPRRGGLARL